MTREAPHEASEAYAGHAEAARYAEELMLRWAELLAKETDLIRALACERFVQWWADRFVDHLAGRL